MAYKMKSKTSNGTWVNNGVSGAIVGGTSNKGGLSRTGVITKTKSSGKSGTTIFGMSPIKFGKTIMKTAAQRSGAGFVAPILRPLSKKIKSVFTKLKSRRTKTKK